VGGEEPRAGGDSIARNTAFAFAVQVTTAAFTAVLTLFLVRSLGAHGYGAFALALSLASLVALPADFGLAASAARFIAEHRGDRPAIARVTREALRLKIVFAGLVSLGLVALAGTIASAYGDHSLAWPLRGAAVSLFGQSMFAFFPELVRRPGQGVGELRDRRLRERDRDRREHRPRVARRRRDGRDVRQGGRLRPAGPCSASCSRPACSATRSSRCGRAAGPRTEGLGRYAAALVVIGSVQPDRQHRPDPGGPRHA